MTGHLLKVTTQSNGLFQKKSKQVIEGVDDINIPGMLKKEHVEIPGVN